MSIQSLTIDNAGFDVLAMSQLTEQEFVDLHKATPAITYGKTEEETVKWLKKAHKAILLAAKPAVKQAANKKTEKEPAE